MIPLRDENPSRTVPFITYILVAANIAVFMWQNIAPEREVYRYLMIPAEIVSGRDYGPVETLQPFYYTIFTAMFMHGGFMHIAGNMLYLWIFGDNVEDMLGHVKFLLFYLACGLIAAMAHILIGPNSVIPTLGASGAVAGVLGGYLVTHGGAKVLSLVILGFFIQFIWLPAWLVLGLWFVLQVVSQTAQLGSEVGGGVAYMAHIGGFLAGMILIFLLGGRKERRAPERREGWGYRQHDYYRD